MRLLLDTNAFIKLVERRPLPNSSGSKSKTTATRFT
jgi:hypothetical protein